MTRLFFGNLSFQVDELELQGFVAGAGYAGVSVEIIRDRDTGRSRGYAFVNVDEDDAGSIIRKLNGQPLRARSLNVARAVAKGLRRE